MVDIDDTRYFKDVYIDVPCEKNRSRADRRRINHEKEIEKRDAILLKKQRGAAKNWKMNLKEGCYAE